MRVLVTNDDGVYAEGLRKLVRALSEVAEVVVIAPERQQSATGHAITLHKPLRMTELEVEGARVAFGSNGTPSDCVILGTLGALPRPDMVVAGINAGANMGEEVLYSGTASAAMEAALQGLPAVAVSVASLTDVIYEGAAEFMKTIVTSMGNGSPLPLDTIFNINVPNVPPEALKPPRLTRLGRRRYSNILKRRIDPRGRPYYWFSGAPVESIGGEGTDIQAIAEGHISITPVHFDLTGDMQSEQITAFVRELAEA